MGKMRVGLIQPSIRPYAVEHNLKILTHQLHKLKSQNVHLVVLPEFFPTGNTFEVELLRTAIQSSDTIQKWLQHQSRELDMIIAGAYLSLEGKNVYNKFVIQEPTGMTICHYKTHSPVFESIYYQLSFEKEYIFKTGIGKIGLITCVEMQYSQITEADYRDCAFILIAFAIPNRFSTLLRRLTSIPEALAKRNGIPVILCSMGGDFHSNGSPIQPLKMRGVYAGRSGVYLPSGCVAGPLPPGDEGTLIAEIPLGPGVETPDLSIEIEAGLPVSMRIFDLLLKRKAEKLYEINLDRWLQFYNIK